MSRPIDCPRYKKPQKPLPFRMPELQQRRHLPCRPKGIPIRNEPNIEEGPKLLKNATSPHKMIRILRINITERAVNLDKQPTLNKIGIMRHIVVKQAPHMYFDFI
ncbi:uncharacterized protein [Gossypium hirsutum]|uniref:Uncharacterized protein n=1 Tax=Gossypium hirsutum TaxID=3635 RepID=A0ABM2Z4S0_GOSHI|nr:uncharacterized protein LOC121209886 [Gossypium hirsutum]